MTFSFPIISSGPSGLARTLAGTGIGTRTLATHGQAAAMAETAIATNVHQTLDVHGGFTAQVTLDGELFAIWSRIFSRSPSVRSLTFLE
jgi:sporulation-control protein spo0M